MERKKKKVALLVESSRAYGRGVLRGIAQYASTRASWILLHQEMTLDTLCPNWLKQGNIDGVIARVSNSNIDMLHSFQVPIVDVLCRCELNEIPRVETDDQEVAHLAFEHLYNQGFRRFAFCGFKSAHYSENRLQHFQHLVEEYNFSLRTYQSSSEYSSELTSLELSGIEEQNRLGTWLKSLKPPTGLFVCNDIRGQHVLNACSSTNIAVPDEIGIIGVDDDDAICLLSNPSLTSITPDTERVGFEAAKTLASLMQGLSVRLPIQYVSPLGISQRLSTSVDATEDREVALACRYIREHACEGIQVSDVVKSVRISRRQLERRFRNLLNRTINQQITNIKIERIKHLLTDSMMNLEQLAKLVGYNHKESLSAIFKRETGQTPGEYRKKKNSFSD